MLGLGGLFTLLTEIATNKATLTFKNSDENHMQVFLTSFRKGLSYDQMAKKLNSIQNRDGVQNPFMMPNDSQYDELIWKGLKTALDYKLAP